MRKFSVIRSIVTLKANKGIRFDKDLAKSAGLSEQTLSKVFSGRVSPTIETMLKLAKVGEVSLSEFISWGE